MGKNKKKSNKRDNYNKKNNNKSNKSNNYNKKNNSKLNNKETLNKEKENNQNDDIVTFTNYDLDKRLILEQTKKLDIEKIFEQTQKTPNKINKWKLISSILFFIVIILIIIMTLFGTNKKCDTQVTECDEIKNEDNTEIKDDEVDDVKKEKYVFLGDSIFEQYMTSYFFKGYDTVNSGVSGITALKTLERLDSGLYEYNPTTIFILLGTNDLYFGYTEEETFEHLKNLINKIHEDRPEIVINVLSLLPINVSDEPKINKSVNENRSNEKINKVNEYLKDFCDSKNINYINVHDILLDENGELDWNYTREGLHITDLGYHPITMELLKYMKK